MPRSDVRIDYDLCMACVCCAQACPFTYLEMVPGIRTDRKDYPRLILEHQCTGCGICEQACPEECITIIKRG
jgi:formate hydrogenlyase subunit 6/NADH:ubiquinone oxidoreductase subunit I